MLQPSTSNDCEELSAEISDLISNSSINNSNFDEPTLPTNKNCDEIKKSALFSTQFSFGHLWNWFLPSCIDAWSSPISSGDESEIIIAYGAKSHLFLVDVVPQNKSNSFTNSKIDDHESWKFRYRDIINVYKLKTKVYHDVFRSNSKYITTVLFDKPVYHGDNLKVTQNEKNSIRVFVGNNDGEAALYDLNKQTTLFQNVPFSKFKRPCCKPILMKKITSGVWLHFRSKGATVFYSMDCQVVMWSVDTNFISVLHLDNKDCSPSNALSQLHVCYMASMYAECTSTRNEHKLAIGYLGGKISIVGFDPINGEQTSCIFFTENCHMDDISSLTFSTYSIGSIAAYREGLLCSISRDSVLKVWSCSNKNEIAEYRLNTYDERSTNWRNRDKNYKICKHDWFAVSFLPRSTIRKDSNIGYEIVVTNKTGKLTTISLPAKSLTSKLRITKAENSFKPKMFSNELVDHLHVVFSITLIPQYKLAITISLDSKMILWDLNKRCSISLFHAAKATFSIDTCLKDKRVAFASSNSVFVLDFKDATLNKNDLSIDSTSYEVQASRIPISNKNNFNYVLWSKKDFERLGQLVIGTIDGEIINYNLNTNSSSNIANKSKFKDQSKVYALIWLERFNATPKNELNKENDVNYSKNEEKSVVLSLHQSGKVMVNYMSGKSSEDIKNYLVGVPDNLDRKHAAFAYYALEDGEFLFLANADGTIDIFVLCDFKSQHIFLHKVRFLAVNNSCISVELCLKTKWLAVTGIHLEHLYCFDLEQELTRLENEQVLPSLELKISNEDKFTIKTISTKIKLSGHRNRITATSWSPFNVPGDGGSILIASASYDKTAIIWDVSKQTALKRFFGHKANIYTIKWCHFNSNYIFTGGEDCLHFWDWTKQIDFKNDMIPSDSDIKKLFLADILEENDADDSLPQLNDCNETTAQVLEKNQTTIQSNSVNTCEIEKKPSSKTISSSSSIKSLFPVSNQIEFNSTKHDTLEDIKWIYRLKHGDSKDIPDRTKERIYLYGDRESIIKFIQTELAYHEKNKNLDAFNLLSMFNDAKICIENAIERSQCDLMMANLSIGISRLLWKRCLQSCLAEASNIKGKSVHNHFSQTLTKWWAYPKEFSALINLYCLNDFDGALRVLLDENLYREAIVLAATHLTSDNVLISDLMYQFAQHRLSLAQTEGAIKCLVACGRDAQALKLLEQQKTLFTDCNSNSILKQYDELINLLKSNVPLQTNIN